MPHLPYFPSLLDPVSYTPPSHPRFLLSDYPVARGRSEGLGLSGLVVGKAILFCEVSVNRTGKGVCVKKEDNTFLIFTSQFHIVDFIWQGLC